MKKFIFFRIKAKQIKYLNTKKNGELRHELAFSNIFVGKFIAWFKICNEGDVLVGGASRLYAKKFMHFRNSGNTEN